MRVASILCLTFLSTAACDSGREVPGGNPGQQNNRDGSVSDSGPTSQDGGSTDGGGFPDALTNCRNDFPVAQGPTQPCCPDWGVDACGAGLFCAAFDGRTQPVCYAEGSRMNFEQCTEDRQCRSESCNLTLNKCRSGGGQLCQRDVGCAVSPQACLSNNPDDDELFCRETSGKFREPCLPNNRCDPSLECDPQSMTCIPPPGTTCGPCENGGCPNGGGLGSSCNAALDQCEPMGPDNMPAPCCASISDCCPNGPTGCDFSQCFVVTSGGVGACLRAR